MTDGPFKSAPIPPVWKKVGNRAWNTSFSPAQIAEAVPRALLRECDPSIVKSVSAAMISSDQGILFHESPHEVALRLDRLRRECPGSIFSTNLIDAAIYELYHPSGGGGVVDNAIEAALRTTAESFYRGLQEHGLRKAGHETTNTLKERLEQADRSIDYAALQRDLSSPRPRGRTTPIPKRSGLDEGVSL